MFEPGYLKCFKNGVLKKRINSAFEILKSCTLCPRNCKVNRLKGEKGFCKTGLNPIISSYGPHFGEESPLVGEYGSGTIFITHCNLGCLFCQNYDISHLGQGEEISLEGFAFIMVSLQQRGCHNINFVSPTHVVPQILVALPLAIEQGLEIPLVYNTGGYDQIQTLKLLEGIFDIYMPDFKFSGVEEGRTYAGAPDYFRTASAAIMEMHRQVGDLKLDDKNIAYQGLLVRHLVMPNDISGTEHIMSFISAKISKSTYINIMDQYRPCGEARKYPDINRRITDREYKNAIDMAYHYGLTRLDARRFPMDLMWE
jgi:putative pyruvate formate lyase activating enzyme